MNNYNSLLWNGKDCCPPKYSTAGVCSSYCGAMPDEQRTKRSLQKYELNKKKLQDASLLGGRSVTVEFWTSHFAFWRKGKWDDTAAIWIKGEWAKCLLLVLLTLNDCQSHCASGDAVHPCFWKPHHLFLLDWHYPGHNLAFLIHTKIHLNQRRKGMKPRGNCANLYISKYSAFSLQANVSAFASFYMNLMEFICSSSP